MRAVVVDRSKRLGFDFAEVGEPEFADGQVLVSVEHVALNRGDINDARSGRLSEGAALDPTWRGRSSKQSPTGAVRRSALESSL